MAPRLRQVRRADAPASVLPRYDFAFGDRDPVDQPGTAWGTVGTWITVLALVPEIFDHTSGFGALYTEPAFQMDPKLRELAIARAGWASESQFVFIPHRKIGRDRGVTEEQMKAIPSWATADCFNPVERAVLAYTDALVLNGGRVSDATFAALQAQFSDEEILVLTFTVALYKMQAIMSRALRLESDDRDDSIMEPAEDA